MLFSGNKHQRCTRLSAYCSDEWGRWSVASGDDFLCEVRGAGRRAALGVLRRRNLQHHVVYRGLHPAREEGGKSVFYININFMLKKALEKATNFMSGRGRTRREGIRQKYAQLMFGCGRWTIV